MDYQAMWTPWTRPGLEHLRLSVDDDLVRADGLIIGVADDEPFRVRYSVRCDGAWRVREVRVVRLDLAIEPVALRADGLGNWTTPEGDPVHELAGCIDIDLAGSPFTNTLPIRRLRMPIGATDELTMAYIQVPELTVLPAPQRYTRLAEARYRYESGDSDFSGELSLDDAELILDYPGVARRVWP